MCKYRVEDFNLSNAKKKHRIYAELSLHILRGPHGLI